MVDSVTRVAAAEAVALVVEVAATVEDTIEVVSFISKMTCVVIANVLIDNGGYGGNSSGSGFRDNSNSSSSKFEEYNAGDDDVSTTPSYPAARSSTSSSSRPAATPSVKPTKAKEVDLLGFADDDESSPSPPAVPPAQTNKALPALVQPNLFDGTSMGG